MSVKNDVESRNLPDKIDVYIINEDGSIASGVGVMPEVFIEEQYAGRLFEKDVALHILSNYGKTVGVMRDTKFVVTPMEYNTRKMILGKVNLP